MSAEANVISRERDAIRQYAEWYSRQGYQISITPPPRELPVFLRTLAPDLLARRDGENIVVQMKTSSQEGFERIEQLARVLEHQAGWKLHAVYVELADPEWKPPDELPETDELLGRLDALGRDDKDSDQRRISLLLTWSIIEAAARHKLKRVGVAPTQRISSSVLIKMLLTEGVIGDEQYDELRRGLAVRNAITHGFLNQTVDVKLIDHLRDQARRLLTARRQS